jgi:hypothetical protein
MLASLACMKMSEIIVLSLFSVFVLAGTYFGQGLFVPQEGEKPVQTAARFASHERTFEVKPLSQACEWAREQAAELGTVSFQAEGQQTEPTDPAERPTAGDSDKPAAYHFVLSEECAETIPSE